MSAMHEILDLARWAPSGDNTQPWRFEVIDAEHVRVHAFDTRDHCVYDLQGHASQLSVGALLETMRIAATVQGRTLRYELVPDAPEEAPLVDVWFTPVEGLAPDPLHTVVRTRSVQRKPLSTRPLDADDKRDLEAPVGPAHAVRWFEGAPERRRMAWLAVSSAKIRLSIPEAYAVHRDIIQWDARYSEDRVPDQALGADPLSLRSMRWVLGSWRRVEIMNRWFGGTLAPRLQLDLLPGLRCAAHFAIVARQPTQTLDARLAAGAAVQRFWLTAALRGLQLQPQYTPLVFAQYARQGLAFTRVPAATERARRVAVMLDEHLGADARGTVFLGRIGHGPPATARSLRLPLDRLYWSTLAGAPESAPERSPAASAA